MIAELIARVFTARDMAHREHWLTRSGAEHDALGLFAAEVGTTLDSVVECYIGMFGVPDMEAEAEAQETIREQLSDDLDWIEANRDTISGGSDHVAALVDNLAAVYSKTIYLLRLS